MAKTTDSHARKARLKRTIGASPMRSSAVLMGNQVQTTANRKAVAAGETAKGGSARSMDREQADQSQGLKARRKPEEKTKVQGVTQGRETRSAGALSPATSLARGTVAGYPPDESLRWDETKGRKR